MAGSPEQFAALIATHARANGVPVELASAVVRHESNYNPRITGRAGEIGLMQIKLQTARGMGYRGSRRGLYDPATNIAWGMKYLGQARQLAGGNECGTLSRYNGGLFIRHLVRSYCRQVIAKSQFRGTGSVRFARNRGGNATVRPVDVAVIINRGGRNAFADDVLASLN
ncbi:MAG TPA: lytic transglycosylase domain-containing protein [Bauldia sp.]